MFRAAAQQKLLALIIGGLFLFLPCSALKNSFNIQGNVYPILSFPKCQLTHHRKLVHSNALSVRGGSLKEQVDTDSKSVLTKVRTLIESLLHVLEKKSSVATTILKSIIRWVEYLIGKPLLPKPAQKKTKISKRGKKQKSSLSQSHSTVRQDIIESSSKPTKGSLDKSHGKTGKRKQDKGTAHNTVKRGVSQKRSKTTSGGHSHLNKPFKSTNSNYRIQRELKEFLSSPPPNLSVKVGKNIRVWIITLTGAKNTIYEGEVYRLRVQFPKDYPTVPPSVYFLQPTPRHEHVYTNGDICLSLLGKDWRPTMTAQSIAMSILSILSGAQSKSLPMDNARHAQNQPGQRQDNWVYHDDNC